MLNVEAGGRTTIVADLADAAHIPSDSFDCIILTQTLQYVYDVPAALRTLQRILKPGGILLATFPGLTQIVEVSFGDHWYWGFTRASASRLFGDAFGGGNVEVRSHGNVLSTISFLHGIAREELCEEDLDLHDGQYQLLVSVRATKPLERAYRAPLVSVVIPCFNHREFLAEAIRSVREQDYPSVEIIVVDDGSTDGSADVATAFPEVRVIRQRNQGLSAARNAGLATSRGEYLLFLDADDRYVPGAISASMRFILEHRECGMVYGRFNVMNPRGAVLHEGSAPAVPRNHYEELLRTNYVIMHGTALYRREVFDRVGRFDPALGASEDYDMYFRVARAFPILRHGAMVADVRKGHTSMTRDATRMLHFSLEVLRRQKPHAERSERLRKAYAEGLSFWRSWYGARIARQAAIARIERRWPQFWRNFASLLREDPRRAASLRRPVVRSNAAEFVVGEGAPLPPVPAAQGLALVRLGIDRTSPGEPFNVQPGGDAALWIECVGATLSTVIVFDGVQLDTVFESPRLVTAIVPPSLYAREGRYTVYLLEGPS